MLRRAAFLAFLLFAPTVATAQRGGASSRATKKDDMFDNKSAEKGPTLKTRDLEDLSPLKLIIDKHKDLKLSDDQVKSCKQTEDRLKQKNEPVLKAIDSLLHNMKYTGDSLSDRDRTRIINARTGFANAFVQLETNYADAAKEAIASFGPDQQAQANDLVAKQRADGEKMVQEKLGPAAP